MFRRAALLLLLALALAPSSNNARAAQQGQWAEVRSAHFTFAGDVGANELSDLAASLEEFHAVFSQILPREYFNDEQPTTVVVFADDTEYEPFKPLREGQPDTLVAGYFKAAQDLDYITLAALGSREETTSVLFHEYVHSLVKNRYTRAPLWLDEGLAEYYSAYTLANGGRQVRFGESLPRRAQTLRSRQHLPLAALLTADRYSPLYNGHSERGIFYAESWALVHYILSDRTGARQRQLDEYLRLTGEGQNVEDALRRSFQISATTLEQRLWGYVRTGAYAGQTQTLAALVTRGRAATQARSLSEAEAQARLGDLLLRTDRLDQADEYLARALALDANLGAAHASLGLLRLRQGQASAALEELRRATELEPQDYLAHYYYAGLLDTEGSEVEFTVSGYAARGALIRAELKRAISLAPKFLDAQGLLVLTDIERNPNLDEATGLLERLTKLAPARREFRLLRARLDLRREQFEAARNGASALVNDPLADDLVRDGARSVLDQIPRLETMAAERRALNGGVAPKASGQDTTQPCDMPEPGPQWKPTRFAGEQSCGRLIKIECAGAGLSLVVRVGERNLTLHAASLSDVKLISYTNITLGHLECGTRAAPELVLVTYRPQSAGSDEGELRAVEFVPEDWIHTLP